MAHAEKEAQLEVAPQRQLVIQNIIAAFPDGTIFEPIPLPLPEQEVVGKVFGSFLLKITLPETETEHEKTFILAIAGMTSREHSEYKSVGAAAADITQAHRALELAPNTEVFVLNINPLDPHNQTVDDLLMTQGQDTSFGDYLSELIKQLAVKGIAGIVTYIPQGAAFNAFARRISKDASPEGRAQTINNLSELPKVILQIEAANNSGAQASGATTVSTES